MDASETVMDASETVMDLSGTVMDASGTVMDASETVMDLSGTLLDPALIVPEIPDILTMADILGEQSLLLAKEVADGDAIRAIGTTPVLGLKPVFVEWVTLGCPDNYPLLKVEIRPPPTCSDGVVRSLPDYIEFCSGNSLSHHIALLQAKLPDIHVAFANLGGSIAAILSRV